MAGLSDADIGLSDDDIGLSAAPPSGGMSDAEIGLSDADIGLEEPNGRPAPETALGTAVREGAHGIVPAGAGLVGAGLGGAAAGALGAGPVGAFVGGLAGMVVASMGANAAQEKLLDVTGQSDAEQRAANTEEHPVASFAGGLAPAVATMSPMVAGKAGAQVLQRGAGGVMMGGFEAGQEYLNEGHVDPAKAAAAAAVGAVFPAVNRVGAKLVGAGERIVPGRPNRTANPAADQAHVDVADATADVEVGNSSLAQSPHVATGETTGNPQSAPERSSRTYAKEAPVPDGEAAPQNTLTEGHADPATIAALEATNPAPAASAPEAPAPQPAVQPVASPNAQKPRLSLKRPPPEEAVVGNERMVEPVVEAGFPQPGEPVAVGANDATPVPAGTPARAAAAIERSRSQQKANEIQQQLTEPSRPMPELKGEAPINASVTTAQKEAGNYPKARTHDFGKPARVETHAGDKRTGVDPTGKPWEVELPYDYGYFNKTKGADKDHIDFARPKEGAPAQGQKHFIIDQRNAETGKFDEHKVFNYYKDEAAAREHYNRGFSDGKGPERLGAITEVDRAGLVKFLQKHTSKAATKPYGDLGEKPSLGVKKPVQERAVMKDAIAKFEAKGDTASAEMLRNAPEDVAEKMIAGKRVRKYGVATGASAGYPVEGLVNSEGKPVTANTKAKAAERSAAHTKMVEWFKGSAPKAENETKDQLIARLIKNTPSLEGWKPTHKPAEWMLAREAAQFIKKPTPGAEKKFREAERLLRGAPEDVEAYRGGNRVEADIARSRRSGDDAVANAEAKNVDLGRNSVEDEMIAGIDAKKAAERKPGFDVPHEEAEAMVKPTPVKSKADLKELPRKTVDAADSSLAKIDTKAISAAELRKAEAAKLAGKKSEKAAGVESEGAAAPVRKISVSDPAEIARLTELMSKAQSKGKGLDALPAEREPSAPRGVKDLLGDFVSDDRGAVDPHKIAADMKRWMSGASNAFKKTEHESYRAMSLKSPEDKAAQKISDSLQAVKKRVETSGVNTLKFLDRIPKEDRNPKIMSEIYHAREADSAHFPLPAGKTGTHLENMSPQAKRVYETYLESEFKHGSDIVKEIRSIAPDRIGDDVESHISRLTKGEMADRNLLKQDDDPTNPSSFHALKTTADQAKARKFYALVGPDGKRTVIGVKDDGFSVWRNYKRENVKAADFEFTDGGTFKAGPVDYTMRQATSKEIERNALGADKKPMKYYDNAAFSAGIAKANLETMARNIIDLHHITQTPEFSKFATRKRPVNDPARADWAETTFPNMEGWYMSPQLKAVFDDFAGQPPSTWNKLNSFVTKSIFWMPVAHIRNVAEHMIVGRGWDNFNPVTNWKLLTDIGPKAIKSVLQQDGFQSQMRHEGAGLIYGSVKTRNLVEKVAQRLGLEIEKNPSEWGPLADKLGVPVKALGRGIWDTSSKVMWSAGDMLMTMRVMELQGKGHSLKQAIIEAERDIPNYRVPHQAVGRGSLGRQWSQVSQNSSLVAFGRYHHGMFNSYANIIKDAISPNASAGDRLDAAGKMLTMAAIAFIVYPVINSGVKALTGNDSAHIAARGPMSVPTHIAEGARGETDASQWIRGSVTLAPLANTVLTWINGKDFRGKPILEPGDLRETFIHGNLKTGARAATAAVEHTARNVISPYGTLANALQKRTPEESAGNAVGKVLRDATLDIKDPSVKAQRYKALVDIRTNRDARTRFKQGGAGPLEGLVGKATGYR